MATVRYEITDGLAPFRVDLYNEIPAIIDSSIWGATGQYYFTNVVDGNYVIRITDATDCYIEFSVEVDCVTTTTTLLPSTTTTTLLPSTTTTSTTENPECIGCRYYVIENIINDGNPVYFEVTYCGESESVVIVLNDFEYLYDCFDACSIIVYDENRGNAYIVGDCTPTTTTSSTTVLPITTTTSTTCYIMMEIEEWTCDDITTTTTSTIESSTTTSTTEDQETTTSTTLEPTTSTTTTHECADILVDILEVTFDTTTTTTTVI